MTELFQRSAKELVSLLRDGEISAVELVKDLHARADQVEPRVGAFAHQLRGRVLGEAEVADERRRRGEELGPLHGLPLTIKESVDTQGVPSTIGMRARSAAVAQRDAVVVQLLRRAGAIILGKTNVPQTLLTPMETTNRLFGTTHNPWRHGHGPGGSSGGEAAALAAGMSVGGIGTDIGGSIRGPASFCGVAGLKPTAFRWSNQGSNSAIPGQEFVRSQLGPMARSADDVALLMEALDPLDHSRLDPRVAPAPLGKSRDVDVSALRVGYYEDDGVLTPAASVRRAVRAAAELLESAGVKVVRFSPPNAEELLYLYFRGISADGSQILLEGLDGEPLIDPLKSLGRFAKMPAQARRALAKTLSWAGERRLSALLEALGEKSVAELWRASARRAELRVEELATWDREGVDIVLAPTYATPAAPIGMSHDFTFGFLNFARYSLLDFPAGSVPITRARPDETHRTSKVDRIEKRAAEIEDASATLPVGVQVVGRPWREDQVLAVMRTLNRAAATREDFPATPITPS